MSSSRPSVLVLDEEIPFPPDTGKRIRTLSLLSHLARTFEVDLLTHANGATPAARAALTERGIRTEVAESRIPGKEGAGFYLRLAANLASPLPYSAASHDRPAYRRRLRELVRERAYDLVHCEWTPYARFREGIDLPWVVAAHNVESQVWRRLAATEPSAARRFYTREQARKMEALERRIFARAPFATAVSEEDAATLRGFGCARVAVVANGVDLVAYTPHPESDADPRALVFTGSLDWRPESGRRALVRGAGAPGAAPRRAVSTRGGRSSTAAGLRRRLPAGDRRGRGRGRCSAPSGEGERGGGAAASGRGKQAQDSGGVRDGTTGGLDHVGGGGSGRRRWATPSARRRTRGLRPAPFWPSGRTPIGPGPWRARRGAWSKPATVGIASPRFRPRSGARRRRREPARDCTRAGGVRDRLARARRRDGEPADPSAGAHGPRSCLPLPGVPAPERLLGTPRPRAAGDRARRAGDFATRGSRAACGARGHGCGGRGSTWCSPSSATRTSWPPLGARWAGVPVVSGRRNFGYWHTPREIRILRFLNRFTREFVANSEAVREQTVRREGVSRERILVIANAVDMERFRPAAPGERETLRAQFGFPATAPLIGCVANLRPVKGHEVLIEAFASVCARVPQARLALVGEGPIETPLRERARALGVLDRLHFLGLRQDVPDLLRAFDVAVLASHSEGLSNALLEAMASGLPTVATAVGGTRNCSRTGPSACSSRRATPPRWRRLWKSCSPRRIGVSGWARRREIAFASATRLSACSRPGIA